MPATEAALLNNFIRFNQNTHRTVVTNSVGMAILVLKKNYFKVTDTEADITKKYERCIEEMKLAVKDQPDRKQMVESLITSAQEPLNKHDDVHLYLPVGDIYTKKTYTFPLKEVITLVWLALKDHEKFAHEINYQGTKEQQFARARSEYKMRLDNFFDLLVGFDKDNICHHGIRNEIVFLLNKIYLGMEIIEDDLSTIAATLKDHINTLFWEHYQNAADQPQIKKMLTVALFSWMNEQDPRPLFKMVDPENKVKKILETLFIRHGTGPDDINVGKLIDNCLPTLNFNYDPKQYPVIKLIENIFNISIENNSPDIVSAITNIKLFILSNAELENTQNAEYISEFYTLYQAYKTLDQRMQMLLRASGNMKESYPGFITACEEYFTKLANANLENEFPRAHADILQIAQELKLSIADFKSAKMLDFVENFFARWNIAKRDGDYSQKRYLYRFLRDEMFQEKIIILDEEIDPIWNPADTSTPFRDITVYQINRILLHAIIREPKDWSIKFIKLFNAILLLIVNEFNSLGNVLINSSLTTDSYPTHMIHILSNYNYAPFIINSEVEQRDFDRFICLPHQVKNAKQWQEVAILLNDEELLEIYQPQKVKIDHLLYKTYTAGLYLFELRQLLRLIPLQYRCAFLLEERVKAFIEADETLWTSATKLVTIVSELIPEDDRVTVLKAFSNNTHNKIRQGTTIHESISLIASLPERDRLTFFNLQPQTSIIAILLLPPADLLTYLKTFPPEKIFSQILSEKRLTCNFDLAQYIELLEYLSTELTIEVIKSNAEFFETLAVFFRGKNQIHKSLQLLSIIDTTVDIIKLSSDKEYWEEIFLQLPRDNRLTFLSILGVTEYLKLFPFANNLQFIANNLPAYDLYLFSLTKKAEYHPALLNQSRALEIINIYLSCPTRDHLPDNIITKLPVCYRLDVLTSWCTMLEGFLLCRNNLITILKMLPPQNRYQFAAMVTCRIDSLSPVNVKPIPIISTMELFTEDEERVKYLELIREKLGSDYVINQFANRGRSWSDLIRLRGIANNVFELGALQKLFLKTFHRIYMALYVGQTSFFKKSNEVNIFALPLKDAIEYIYSYATRNPNSRSAKALSLMKTHDSYTNSNTNLLNDIYIYSYANSGLFKRAKDNNSDSRYFYTTSALSKNIRPEFSFMTAFALFPDSRSARIYKVMRVDDERSNPENVTNIINNRMT